jgi:hypothetical protein
MKRRLEKNICGKLFDQGMSSDLDTVKVMKEGRSSRGRLLAKRGCAVREFSVESLKSKTVDDNGGTRLYTSKLRGGSGQRASMVMEGGASSGVGTDEGEGQDNQT